MGESDSARTLRVLAGLILIVIIGPASVAGEVERLWMPETLPGLVHAMELGIAQSLTPTERAALSTETREELQEIHPELHAKIRRSYVRWTDEWIRRNARKLVDVPERQTRRAEQAAADVDSRLRAYFGAKGWTYRPLDVIFVPKELMAEPGGPSISNRGMYVVFYPDVFFAALGPDATMRQTLIHEGLHFNKTGPGLGQTLAEGIVEAAATHLALEWEMARKSTLREANYYPRELQVVNYILDRMSERAGIPSDEALEMLLHTYLTGEATEMESIFGTTAWSEIVQASRDLKKVRKTAKRVLGD
jgi:hypothetical protein